MSPKLAASKDGPTSKDPYMTQATKKPANLSVNAMPSDGYVMAVDGKLKARYESEGDAIAAASKLKQSYPVLQVAVYDAAQRTYTVVGSQEK
jgi:hypothetical protein